MGVMTETTPEQPSETTTAAVPPQGDGRWDKSHRRGGRPFRLAGACRHSRRHCVHHRGDLLERFHTGAPAKAVTAVTTADTAKAARPRTRRFRATQWNDALRCGH